MGLNLAWQLALPSGIYLASLGVLTLAYRDKKLLRFLAPFALCQAYMIVPGSYRYEMSEAALAEITGAFLATTAGLSLWLVYVAKPSRAPAAFLAFLATFYALLASAFAVIRDM